MDAFCGVKTDASGTQLLQTAAWFSLHSLTYKDGTFDRKKESFSEKEIYIYAKSEKNESFCFVPINVRGGPTF